MTSDVVVGQADLAFQSNLYRSTNPTRRWIHERRHQWVLKQLQWTSTGQDRVGFDCGVGCGIYTRQMVARGMTVVGIDVNRSFAEAVSKVPGVVALVADICKPQGLPWQNFADVAVCSEVLEHVPHPDDAIRELHRALKPGGILILTTPQKWSTTELTARLLKVPGVEWLARKIYKEPVEELGHISLLTSAQLQEKLKSAGFEILEHEVFSFYLPVVAEFGGTAGQKVLEWMEGVLRHTPGLKWLVWTQGYVLRKSQ